MKENLALAIAVIALVVGAWAVFGHGNLNSNGSKNFGATSAGNMLAENYIPYVMYNGGFNTAKSFNASSDVTLGTSGTTFSAGLIGTTCNLIGSDVTVTASTSRAFDCAVTGVTSSFSTMAQLATSTGSGVACSQGTANCWSIIGSKASSTAGFVTVVLLNQGPSAIPSVTAVGSSTVIWAFK